MSNPPFRCSTRIAGSTIVIDVAGELDIATAPQLREVLLELVIGQGSQTVVLDLSALEFVDSTGLGLIVGLRRRLVATGGELVLWRPTNRVARVIEISGLSEFMRIETGALVSDVPLAVAG